MCVCLLLSAGTVHWMQPCVVCCDWVVLSLLSLSLLLWHGSIVTVDRLLAYC